MVVFGVMVGAGVAVAAGEVRARQDAAVAGDAAGAGEAMTLAEARRVLAESGGIGSAGGGGGGGAVGGGDGGVAGANGAGANGASSVEDARVASAAVVVVQGVEVDPNAISIVEQVLARDANDAAAKALVRAIEREAAPSMMLYAPVARRAARLEPADAMSMVGALASFPTRDAARLILRTATRAREARLGADAAMKDGGRWTLDSAALGAMRRLSGRSEMGGLFEVWAAWLDDADRMSEEQWRLSLARSQAQRAQRAEAERAGLGTRLVESLRRLHLATPAEERGAFLAGLVRDPLVDVRALGLELATRELQASGRLGPEVGQAALGLLSSQDPRERTRAAAIVRQVSPEGGGPAVEAALVGEADAVAAGELALAAARWPTRRTVATTLAWIEGAMGPVPGSSRGLLLDAAWRLARTGELARDDAARVLAAVRAMPDSALGGSGVALLASLGGGEDRARLVAQLQSDVAAVRIAAAEGLAWDAQRWMAVVEAAETREDLFDVAVMAVMVNTPSEELYRRLSANPASGTEAGRRGLARVASLMPAVDVASVAGSTRDRVLRADLLLLLTDPRRIQSEWPRAENARAILRGAIELAQVRLEDGDAAGAAAVLSGLPIDTMAVAGMGGVEQARHLRAVAVIALGRYDDEVAAAAPAEAWVDAMRFVSAVPAKAELAREILTRFPSELTEAQQSMVEGALVAAAAEPERASREGGTGGEGTGAVPVAPGGAGAGGGGEGGGGSGGGGAGGGG
jgi:hypothetical protein